MQRHTVSLLIALILLGATSAGAYPAESSSTIIPSIIMDAPQGYVEIDPEEFPDFARPLATEFPAGTNELLRIFVKADELPHVESGDFDLLTGVVTAFWYKGPGESVNRKERGRSGELLVQNPGFLLLMTSRMDSRRFNHIQEMFLNREVLPATEKMGLPLPEFRVREWLQKGPDAPDLELGCIETGSRHALFAWLQADTDVLDFGVMAQKPLAVGFALVAVEDKLLCLAAASSFGAPAGASTPVELLSSYLANEKHTFTLVQGRRIERRTDCYNLLSSVAEMWERQGKTDKAAAVYKRRMLFLKKASLPNFALTQVLSLAALYLKNGRYDAMLREVPPLLEEGQTALGADHPTVLLLKELLGAAYESTGKLPEAVALYTEALASALRVYGPINENTISIQAELSATLVLCEEYGRALSLSEEAFVGAVELHEPTQVTQFGLQLGSNASEGDQMELAFFYGKLAAGLACYNDNTGPKKNLLEEQTGDEAMDVLCFYLERTGLAADPATFKKLWYRPNEASETPYTRAREFMIGDEIPLYERFGKVAEALRKAGLSGTEAEKEEARADFRAWMDSVRETLAEPAPESEMPGDR